MLRPRYAYYILLRLFLHISYSYKVGRKHLYITKAMMVDWTCINHLQNLVDRIARLVLNALLVSERCVLSSANFSDFKLHYPVSTLLGDVSQISRTLLRKPPQYAQHNSLASLLNLSFLGRDLFGRRHQSNLASVTWLWLCVYFWRFQPTFSSLRNLFPPEEASFLEQFINSSFASFARAIYDHLLVEDLSKLAFKYESAQASIDFPSIASFPKLSILLENS